MLYIVRDAVRHPKAKSMLRLTEVGARHPEDAARKFRRRHGLAEDHPVKVYASIEDAREGREADPERDRHVSRRERWIARSMKYAPVEV